MFDKPNERAFHAIVIFLFKKLGRYHGAGTLSAVSHALKDIKDSEFSKAFFKWIRDIAKENPCCLPKVTPSSLISPCGPKLVDLLYQLSRHVVIENMKKNSIGTGIPLPEAFKLKPTNVAIANARHNVARNKLAQALEKEDFIIREYKKKSWLLVKEIREIKSEYEFLQVQLSKMKENNQNKRDITEKIQKVRSMWSLVLEKLTSLKKDKENVDSVLGSRHEQCILDGTKVFRIPQLLIDRVESGKHQLCTGNLYEGEKLNFLTLIQLLNEALRILRHERSSSELKHLLDIENMTENCKQLLKDLTAKRLEIEQQHCVSASASVRKEQEDWLLKWESFLGMSPFDLLVDQDPVLGFLRASQPHSSNPAEDEDDSEFSPHVVSVSNIFGSVHEGPYEKDGASEIVMNKSTSPPKRISSVPLDLSKASENREVLIEKSLPVETCKYQKNPISLKSLKNGKDESATSEMQKDAGDNVIQTEPPVKRKDLLKKARDELVEEVANPVMSKLPQNSEGKRMELDDLVIPFITRKQIPQTPENLLTEIRSSWRKAIQTEDSSDQELAPSEAMAEESPMDARLRMQKTSDSRLVRSVPAPPVPGFEYSLLEKKSQLRSTEFKSKKQLRQIIEPAVLETSGMQENETIEGQELKCIVSNKSSTEDPEGKTFPYVKVPTTTDTCSENNRRTDVLPSDYFQGSLMDSTLHWNVSSLSCIIPEDRYLGIWDETFPEELCSTDLSLSIASEGDSCVSESVCVTDGSKNEDIRKSNLNLWSPFNTCEVLKQTESVSEDGLRQTHNGAEFVSSRSDPSLATEKRHEWNSPLKLFCLDEEFTKTPLLESLDERKHSLSSLLVSSQHLEEMASMTHEIPSDILQKLKEKDLLNEKLGMKEPSSE